VSVLQTPSSFVALSDLAVKCRALTWWGVNGDCKEAAIAPKALSLLDPADGDAVVIGWGGGDDPEWGCVHAASAYGAAGVIAADWALNLAALGNLNLPAAASQADARGVEEKEEEPTGKHTVSFLMSDGDNVQWLLNDWSFTEDNWWNSPDRGSVPLGWTLSPSLAALAPTALAQIYGSKTDNDQFLAGPSGAVYSFPNDIPEEVAGKNAEETAYWMKAAGHSVVNVIADSDGVGGGTPDTMKWLLGEDQVESVFLYDFNGYAGLEGEIDFVGGKPVIGGRFSLWSPDFYDVQGLADALMGLENLEDGGSSDGYSLIPVHAWSHSVSDVLAVAQLLEQDGRFDVVLPDELVRRVNAFVKQ
jgi:hypothetical protein